MRANSRKVESDGIIFDSQAEYRRYGELKMLQRCGDISQLQVHPQFTFIVQGVPIAKYKPDFSYHDKQDHVRIEDVKGFRKSKKTGKMLPRVDREFGIKCKLMLACFGLEVEVVA